MYVVSGIVVDENYTFRNIELSGPTSYHCITNCIFFLNLTDFTINVNWFNIANPFRKQIIDLFSQAAECSINTAILNKNYEV